MAIKQLEKQYGLAENILATSNAILNDIGNNAKNLDAYISELDDVMEHADIEDNRHIFQSLVRVSKDPKDNLFEVSTTLMISEFIKVLGLVRDRALRYVEIHEIRINFVRAARRLAEAQDSIMEADSIINEIMEERRDACNNKDGSA